LAKTAVRLVSYSQNAEDVVLMRAFFDTPRGHFVDVGAGHPEVGSLTHNLSSKLAWLGVNIEPQDHWYRKLCRVRARDVNLQLAAGSGQRQATLFRVEDEPGLTTTVTEIAHRHRRTGLAVYPERVAVQSLDDILAAVVSTRPELGRVDLVKIDVEGAEHEVLRGFDLVRWSPRALVVEAVRPGTLEPSHAAWEPAVLAAGYRLTLFDGLNRFYARDSADNDAIAQRLSVPANTLDDYVPLRWYRKIPPNERPDIRLRPWH
jgi:FkbM family methyltransferase